MGIFILLEATVHRYGPLQVSAWFDHRPQIAMSEDEEDIGLGDIFTVCTIHLAYLGYH